MNYGPVLNIGTRANVDEIHVGAKDAVIPDACPRPDLDIADDPASLRDEGRRMDARRFSVERNDADIVHLSRLYGFRIERILA